MTRDYYCQWLELDENERGVKVVNLESASQEERITARIVRIAYYLRNVIEIGLCPPSKYLGIHDYGREHTRHNTSGLSINPERPPLANTRAVGPPESNGRRKSHCFCPIPDIGVGSSYQDVARVT